MLRYVSALLGSVLVLACAEAERERTPMEVDDGPLSVFVVNYPLQYFAERIGGDHVEVVLPAPPGVDPAVWTPSPEVVSDYQSADLIVENGAGYAAWTAHATLPSASRVNTASDFGDRLIVESRAVTHGHGPEGEHSHPDTAFTTWLDPTLAIQQSRAIAKALSERRPDAEQDFSAGLAELEADLGDLDARLRDALRPFADRPVLFSHPVYQYFARRYGLEGDSLHWEPGESQDESEWADLAERLAETPVRVIFFEGEPHPEVESRLRGLGIRTLVFEPGGARPEGRDWLELMHQNASRVERAHTASASQP